MFVYIYIYNMYIYIYIYIYMYTHTPFSVELRIAQMENNLRIQTRQKERVEKTQHGSHGPCL